MRTPTRDELSAAFKDHRLVIAVEALFKQVSSTLTSDELEVMLNSIAVALESVQSNLNETNKKLDLALTDTKNIEQLNADVIDVANPVEVKLDVIDPTNTADDQIAQLSNEIQSLNLAPQPTYPHLRHSPYGEFYDTTAQTAAAINTAYPITFNTTVYSDGVELGATTSRVYVLHEGTYNFQATIELTKSAAAAGNVWIWTRINGTDVPNSAMVVTLSGSNADITQAWNDIYYMAAGDYFEIVWATDDTNCQTFTQAASAFAPAVPSIRLSVVDNINAIQY